MKNGGSEHIVLSNRIRTKLSLPCVNENLEVV